MRNSLWSVDRATHLKIVAVSLAASIVVVIVGMTASNTAHDGSGATVVKAGKPVSLATKTTSTIR